MDQERKALEFEKQIGYSYNQKGKLLTALCHSSYANERHLAKSACNERFEFLGDAVLELVSSDMLFIMHPEMPEGELTRLRASIVCEPTLAFCARELKLGDYLLLGKGEDMTGGRDRDSVLSDALEAVIGSLYLDGGLEIARWFIHRHVLNDLEHKQLFFDSKTILQEMVQKHFGEPIVYELLGEQGPDHCKTFTSRVTIGGHAFASGSGKSKKAAEQSAAYRTIIELKKQGYERE